METINFNDFTPKERYDIIKEFLVKMRGASSMPSKDLHVQKFYEHYLRKFYKLPDKLVNDIAYCQRAMKSHLATHQTIVDVFGQQEDADPVIKNNYLHELEDMLYELNAECQYLVLRLQDDIDRFCQAFREHNLKPDELVIKDIVSEAIVPLIVAPEQILKPYFVVERPTEEQLLRKYFIIETSEEQPPEEQAPPPPPPPVAAVPQPPPKPKQLLPDVEYTENVKASRLNLQAALKRARSQYKPAEKVKEKEKGKEAQKGKEMQKEKGKEMQKEKSKETQLEKGKETEEEKGKEPPKRTKEYFMQSVGLCTHKEHQQMQSTLTQTQKRKPKPTEKTKGGY